MKEGTRISCTLFHHQRIFSTVSCRFLVCIKVVFISLVLCSGFVYYAFSLGFKDVPKKGDNYTVYTELKSWQDAKKTCEDGGQILASVTSEEINNLLKDKFEFGINYWIGLNDRETEGKFIWGNGEAVSYANWAQDEPDNSEDYFDCVNSNLGKWSAVICDTPKQFVCENVRLKTLSMEEIINKINETFSFGSKGDSSDSSAAARSLTMEGIVRKINETFSLGSKGGSDDSGEFKCISNFQSCDKCKSVGGGNETVTINFGFTFKQATVTVAMTDFQSVENNGFSISPDSIQNDSFQLSMNSHSKQATYFTVRWIACGFT